MLIFMKNMKSLDKEVYQATMEESINYHDKILRRLGLNKLIVPNRFKVKQDTPISDKNRKEHQEFIGSNFMVIFSSHRLYALVKFISNKLGYPILFYIERGKSLVFGLTKLFLKNIENNKPDNLLWVVTEAEIRHLCGLVAIP